MDSSSIRPVTMDDVIGLERYEQIRDEVRRRTIELKRSRRVAVGDIVTFVFENHATVFFQIQEMIRAERIVDLDAVRFELEVYNALLPEPGQLSATMLIEVTNQEEIPERLNSLIGIDEAVRLEIEGQPSTAAEFEAGHSREDKLSAVQYVRFTLDESARAAFRDPSVPARLVIDHPNYRQNTAIEGAVRESLLHDLDAVA
jgi:Protein of unknown function (DUF3501)